MDSTPPDPQAALDAGLAALNQPVSLVMRAIVIECSIGAEEAALRRVNAAVEQAQKDGRQPLRLLVGRAELLEKLGRNDLARRAWADSSTLLAGFSLRRRQSTAQMALATKIRHGLTRTGGGEFRGRVGDESRVGD